MPERFTPLPNEIIDQHLPHLTLAQLKVLLVIVRQTLGWRDHKTKRRKRKDWMSISFFAKRTELTHKSISLAIAQLIHKKLIMALDYHENILHLPTDRRGKKRIYYTYTQYFNACKHKTSVLRGENKCTYPPITKETPTKERTHVTISQSDADRYLEIMRKQKK